MLFCGISTGQFGFPVEEAAPIAVSVVTDWAKQHAFPETIILSTYTNEEQMAYGKIITIIKKKGGQTVEWITPIQEMESQAQQLKKLI